MDLIKLSRPATFINARAGVTWREILYGMDNELLAPGAAVDFAGAEIAENPSQMLIELACIGKGEPTRPLVEQLANVERQQGTDEIREKWLYLVLASIFEHRASYPDPLQTVEEVYADFGYPQRISGFVRIASTSRAGATSTRHLPNICRQRNRLLVDAVWPGAHRPC